MINCRCMKQTTGKELLAKLKEGNISPEERRLLEAWYDEYIDASTAFDDVPSFVKDMQRLDEAFPFTNRPEITRPSLHRLRNFRIGAAAAIALIAFGAYFLHNQHGVRPLNQISQQEVLPGSTGATLTLGDGKKISLNSVENGELNLEGGIHLVKDKDGQLTYILQEAQMGRNEVHTLSTAKGETYTLILPDKSKVWLNAESTLTYNTVSVQRGQRRISLDGEAYFEVAKDSKHPFIVSSHGQEVEVLGTSFNINAYQEMPAVETTLLEGAVKLSTQHGASALTKVLAPNQRATVKQGEIHIREVMGSDAIAWKDGFFLFDSENLESVMNKVSRWYNVEVVYDNPSLKHETMLGTMSKYEKLSTVLDIIERTGIAQFEVKQRTVYVRKK